MKTKLFITFLTSIFLITSCKNKETSESFTLKGEIKGDIPNYIYLEYGNIKDSSLVKNNRFHFTGRVTFPIEAQFSISPVSTIDKRFYLENTNIKMDITVHKKDFRQIKNLNFIKIDTVIGTKTALLRYDFEKFEDRHKADKNWKTELFDKLNKLIEKNPRHHYSGNLLVDIARKSVLDTTQLKILFKKLDTSKQSASTVVSLSKIIYPKFLMKTGDNIYDFILPNDKGMPVNTKKFRGSILLIDFWASWCSPCRAQNPEFLKLYNKYKDKGFEMLGVSTDKQKKRWLAAVKKDGLTWQNVIDTGGYKSKILAKYNVLTSIPHNFLIDRKGKILAKDLSVEELRKLLKKIL